MADKYLLTIDTAANLETLRAASGLINGLFYHDSTNGIRYIATAANAFKPLFQLATTGVTYGNISDADQAIAGRKGFGIAPTAVVTLKAGGTAPGTAPLKLTTQVAGLLAVEQGTFELVGNSLQFTQLLKRRGIAMSQSVRVINCSLNNTVINSYTQFTADLALTVLTVSAIAAGNIVIGQQITCTGAVGSFYVVSQTSGTPNGIGVYVVSKSQSISSTNSWRGALMLVEHGANYLEVGKMEEAIMRGTMQQNTVGNGVLTVLIRYNGTAATVTLATASGNIAASDIDIKVFATTRTINATTGTIQFNAEMRIRTSLTAETVISGSGLYTGDTTAAYNIEISAAWSVANATNLFTINQGRVLCIEPNR